MIKWAEFQTSVARGLRACLIRAGASPPPSFGQCPKENIFFKGGVPLPIRLTLNFPSSLYYVVVEDAGIKSPSEP